MSSLIPAAFVRPSYLAHDVLLPVSDAGELSTGAQQPVGLRAGHESLVTAEHGLGREDVPRHVEGTQSGEGWQQNDKMHDPCCEKKDQARSDVCKVDRSTAAEQAARAYMRRIRHHKTKQQRSKGRIDSSRRYCKRGYIH